ncbi:hypothetical protein FS837_001236 [Tulasnella sp. UAMH 9824]|nr:hypothetical protein FS837_001236 [Tulasnella sp. UAMH 9824]
MSSENKPSSSATYSRTLDQGPFADIIAERVAEWEYLTSTYSAPSPEYVFQVTEPGHGFKFSCGPWQLSVTTALTYPAFAPSYQLNLVNEKAQEASDATLAALETGLRNIAEEKRGEVFLKDLIEEIRQFVRDPSAAYRSRTKHTPKKPNSAPPGPPVVEPPDEDQDAQLTAADQPHDETRDPRYWLDQQLIGGVEHLDAKAAQSFMGKVTIQSITKSLPSSVRLLHAEIILRAQVVRRFNEAREALISKYVKEAKKKVRGDKRRWQDVFADRFTQIDVVYYGTQRQHVGSIVRSGFVTRGMKTVDGAKANVIPVSDYCPGGVHTSSEVARCMGHSDTTKGGSGVLPGQKVLVCAALLGKQYQISEDNLRDPCSCYGLPEEALDCDSAVTPDKEYMVFDPTHLLPLYVLHLEDSSNTPSGGWKGEEDSSSTIPSAKERKKLATAQAKKHFPYGFGAAGSRFVVEEVASPQDDEEEWGEHQTDRLDLQLTRLDAFGEFQRMRL